MAPRDGFLTIDRLCVAYGGVIAVEDVSLSVPRGGVHGVLGANGAGKTSLLKAIAGAVRSTSGSVALGGATLDALPSHRRCRAGVVLVPEGRRILGGMTVEENLALGIGVHHAGRAASHRLEQLYADFPLLAERRRALGGLLSGGEQQQLAIARALACDPTLLLLDEPSLGLAPKMIDIVFDLIERLNANGLTILLVEQNARKALQLVSHVYVMAGGRIVLRGAPAAVADDAAIHRAYLGG